MASTVTDAHGTRPLEDDPVWNAAVLRARRATRAEMERIAGLSATMGAVNALDSGAKLESLTLGGIHLGELLLPQGGGHGGIPSPRAAFLDFVRAHGFEVDSEARVKGLQFDARVFPSNTPREVRAQVDFVVMDPRLATGTLVESFAGYGPTWQTTLGQTIQKFERGDVHVIIAGLLDRTMCADQVTWETLSYPGGDFDVCLGAQLVLYSDAPGPRIGALLDALYGALATVALSQKIHSLRLFVWLQDGVLRTVELLLDNETWPLGEELVTKAEWPKRSGHLGTRLFALLLPRV